VNIPATTSSVGAYEINGTPFLHNFAASGTTGQNTWIGIGAGNLTLTGSSSGTSGSENVAIGYDAATAITTGAQTTAVGNGALYAESTGAGNTALGFQAGYGMAGTQAGNTYVGASSCGSNCTAASSQNTALGYQTMANASGGNKDLALGYQALLNSTGGSYNIVLGWQAGYDLTSGSNNIILGEGNNYGSRITSGSNNIEIGEDLDILGATTSNQIDIGNVIFATGIGTGSTVQGNVGIDTATPAQALTVNGLIQILPQGSGVTPTCGSTQAGTIAMTSTGILCSCISSAWVNAGTGLSCTF
jgi:hypothetical protein